jgi:putative oxidoreductase
VSARLGAVPDVVRRVRNAWRENGFEPAKESRKPSRVGGAAALPGIVGSLGGRSALVIAKGKQAINRRSHQETAMYEEIQQPAVVESLQARGLTMLRIGIGLVFVWFGLPKLVPGLSPAEELVTRTVTCCDPSWFVPLLGTVEVVIGLCFWSRRFMPVGLLLMAGHMCGTVLPLFTLPEITWKSFPVATLEGQYIIKNVVLIAGAMVLAGSEPNCIVAWVRSRIWGPAEPSAPQTSGRGA